MAVYRQSINYDGFPRQDRRPQQPVHSSVIIVSFGTGEALLECLESVFQQSERELEAIVVDNGGNEGIHQKLAELPLLWVRPPINVLPSEGRNVGAHFARGQRLIFLDDDAVMDSDYVRYAREAMETYGFVALRGKVAPKTNSEAPLPPHYDLGGSPLPAVLVTEGNMVIQRDVFVSVGGFDSLMFGREGLEFTYRCLQQFPQESIYYWPSLTIYHDFASDKRLKAKRVRQALAKEYLQTMSPAAVPLSSIYKEWYDSGANGSVPELGSIKMGKTATEDSISKTNQTATGQGVSIIIRAGEDLRSVERFLDSFVRHNTHKPVEILLPVAKPQEALSLIRPYISRVLVRLLPENRMSSQTPLSQLIETAWYNYILFLDKDVVWGNDALPELLKNLVFTEEEFISYKSEQESDQPEQIRINKQFFLSHRLVMKAPSIEQLPANIALSALLEHLIYFQKKGTQKEVDIESKTQDSKPQVKESSRQANAVNKSHPVNNQKKNAKTFIYHNRCLTINDNTEYINLINQAKKIKGVPGRPPVKEKIIAGMATIPSRVEKLPQVLERLKPQFDSIYVYLNGHSKVPDCVRQDNIYYAWSKNHGDLAAAGKFFFLPEAQGGYYFSLDDDFLYPKNYAYKMITTLKKYKDKIPICVHGSIFGEPLEWYFERIAVYSSRAQLPRDRFVSLLGTGTLAFHTDSMDLDFSDFYPTPMCDIQVSLKARKHNLPIISLARKTNWLGVIRELKEEVKKGSGPDYWNRMLIDDNGRTKAAQKYDWSFDSYKRLVLPLIDDIYPNIGEEDLEKHLFDMEFINSARLGKIPSSWNSEESILFYKRKYQFLSKQLKVLTYFKKYSMYPDLNDLFFNRQEILVPVEINDLETLKNKTQELSYKVSELTNEVSKLVNKD